MRTMQLFHTSLSALAKGRMRSLLTSLGIIIGTASVIIMMAVGQGSQKLIEAQIDVMGTNLLQIMAQHAYGAAASLNPAQLTGNDLAAIKEEALYASYVSGTAQGTFTVQGAKGNGSATITGVEPDYPLIKNRTLFSGSFFDEDDSGQYRRVCVVGTTTVAKILGCGPDEAVGKTLQIGNGIFTVKGVLAPVGTSGGRDQDDLIWVPLGTFLARMSATGTLDSIAVSIVTKEKIPQGQADLTSIIRESHRLSPGQPDDFSIMNSTDILNVASSTAKTMTALLASIAAVSLLVGGIGIMNIMLVSVTERIKEIGLLMAIGATKSDILLQFLLEASMLGLGGGIAGILLALASCQILSHGGIPTSIAPWVILTATGASILVGAFFGFWPALKASRLRPIEALHYE